MLRVSPLSIFYAAVLESSWQNAQWLGSKTMYKSTWKQHSFKREGSLKRNLSTRITQQSQWSVDDLWESIFLHKSLSSLWNIHTLYYTGHAVCVLQTFESWKNCLNISTRVTVLNVRNDVAADLLLPFCDRGGSAIKLIQRGDIGRVRKKSVEEKRKMKQPFSHLIHNCKTFVFQTFA